MSSVLSRSGLVSSRQDAGHVEFVDFDSVLRPLGEAAFDERFNLIKNANLFCWRSILEDLLEPHPSLMIIVSSDWRRLYDDEILVRLLCQKRGCVLLASSKHLGYRVRLKFLRKPPGARWTTGLRSMTTPVFLRPGGWGINISSRAQAIPG